MFRILFQFRRYILPQSCLHGVQHTSEQQDEQAEWDEWDEWDVWDEWDEWDEYI